MRWRRRKAQGGGRQSVISKMISRYLLYVTRHLLQFMLRSLAEAHNSAEDSKAETQKSPKSPKQTLLCELYGVFLWYGDVGLFCRAL